jgi:hypothetical protein
MVTISPSEPLLAEAAFLTMTSKLNMDLVPTKLLEHIDSSYLDPGNKGEVIAALLLLLARDKAINNRARPQPFPLDTNHGRIITVSEFLDALLPTDHHQSVEDQKPSRYTQQHGQKMLKEAFAGGYIWFNHFVKVNDFLMVNRQNLWCLISRGAAVVCPNNQRGIDILIPIIFGNRLEPKSVSAILIQVKNNYTYTNKVDTLLFDSMDPFKVRLFSKGETPCPVIRLVFALASKTATVTSPSIPRRRSSRTNSKDKYTAYDIWVAGTTHESFGVISKEGASTYTRLLQRSCKVFNGYDLFEEASLEQSERVDARREMHPGAAAKIAHQLNYISKMAPSMEFDDSEDVEED